MKGLILPPGKIKVLPGAEPALQRKVLGWGGAVSWRCA